MSTRSRTLSQYSGGSKSYQDVWGSNNSFPQGIVGSKTETDTSVNSPGPPYVAQNNWDNLKVSSKKPRLSGKYIIYGSSSRYYSWDNYTDWAVPSPSPTLPPTVWQDLVNRALAQANPNAPIIDAPLFVFELKDVPTLLRSVGFSKLSRSGNGGRTGSHNPADHYLAQQFGWNPLISDLRTFANLANAISARKKALSKASRRKSMRVKLGSSTTSWNGNTTYSISNLYYKMSYTLKQSSWATMSYVADVGSLPDDGDGLSQLNWALGTAGSASTLWNMIPWSWMIDYFTTIGSYLEANRGNIQWKAESMCVMQHSKLDTSATITSQSWRWKNASLTGGDTWEWKKRRVYSVPQARAIFSPLLSTQQVMNLGALALSSNSLRRAVG